MRNYRFKITYRTDTIPQKIIELSVYYETYYQAYTFILGYIAEMQNENKNDRITDIRIEKI